MREKREKLAFWFGLAVVLGAIYLLFNPPKARSQEMMEGRGLFCDTPAQVERFMHLNTNGNPREVLAQVNREEGNEQACIIDAILLTRGETLKTIKDHNGKLWDVAKVSVIALRTPFGWMPVENEWWTAFPSDKNEA